MRGCGNTLMTNLCMPNFIAEYFSLSPTPWNRCVLKISRFSQRTVSDQLVHWPQSVRNYFEGVICYSEANNVLWFEYIHVLYIYMYPLIHAINNSSLFCSLLIASLLLSHTLYTSQSSRPCYLYGPPSLCHSRIHWNMLSSVEIHISYQSNLAYPPAQQFAMRPPKKKSIGPYRKRLCTIAAHFSADQPSANSVRRSLVRVCCETDLHEHLKLTAVLVCYTACYPLFNEKIHYCLQALTSSPPPTHNQI